MRLAIFILIILLTKIIYCQKEKLKITPEAYKEWRVISEPNTSSKGNIITYVIKPQIGNGDLVIKNNFIKKSLTIPRGKKTFVAPNEKWMIFTLQTEYDTIRKLKLENVKKDKWPTEIVSIYNTKLDSISPFKEVESYKTATEKGDWIALLRTEKFDKKPDATKKKKWQFWKKEKETVKKQLGKSLSLYNPLTFEERTIKHVINYALNSEGTHLFYSTAINYYDSIDSCFVYRYNFNNHTKTLIEKEEGYIKQLASDINGEQLAYLFSNDTAENKVYGLKYWSIISEANKNIDIVYLPNLDSNESVSDWKQPYFSKNGNYLYFDIGERPKNKTKDSLTDDEKYSLDLWSWTDNRLQTQQLKNLEKDRKETSLYIYNTQEQKVTKIRNRFERNAFRDKNQDKSFTLIRTQTPYLKEMTWDGWYYDYYKVYKEKGKRSLILNHHNDRIKLSENGNKLAFYNQQDSAWFVKDLLLNTTFQLTNGKHFYNQYHDTPGNANSAGEAIWDNSGINLIIKGQYDYWQFNTINKKKTRLTFGRESKTVYNYWKTNHDSINTINLSDNIFFKTYNEVTKKEGIAKMEKGKVKQLFEHDKKIQYLKKAKNSNLVLLREMDFKTYPNLQVTNLSFETIKPLSSVNQQQKKYNWGTVELVNWNAYKTKDSLSGLFYKPENFDSSKSYPMIIYFYERNSQNLHRYYAPKPTASIVYPTEYVSNGYLVFIPDVKYEIGKPAKSAYNCIVSGTEALIKKYNFIDSNRIGIQGQSWGGYQVAQLITMTNRYKCAMAGAPVSNMFSAYGGIRWGSGLNRAFQYEKGQSRIGKTIWEAPELYIENSPIFHLTKVETPLLIMHNDSDGAVPWTQGIELFNGLRRLQKPVWMLNYNNDAHNLSKYANKLDLSIRMRQFFDYYLQNKTPPKWVKTGRSAFLKELEISN